MVQRGPAKNGSPAILFKLNSDFRGLREIVSISEPAFLSFVEAGAQLLRGTRNDSPSRNLAQRVPSPDPALHRRYADAMISPTPSPQIGRS